MEIRMKNMRMANTAAILALCLLLAACGTQNENTPDIPDPAAVREEAAGEFAEAETADKESAEAAATDKELPPEPKTAVKETVIDFPFPLDIEEGCKLTLACMDTDAGLYELRFYGKDENVAQKLSCGKLQEPIRFSYDDLANVDYAYDDLEIFSDGAESGLLFIPAKTAMESGTLFLEDAVTIPVYQELLGNLGKPCTFTENETQWEKSLFDVDTEQKSIRTLRRMTLQKESGLLEIWDCLKERSVFSGKASCREDGSLANPEYYEYLFSNSPYGFYQNFEDTAIPVWYSYTEGAETPMTEEPEKNPFEKMQKTVFGSNGHMAEYKDRETFLTDFGFAGQEPFYRYEDNYGNLQLEFYLNEESGSGCGLVHQPYGLHGFAFDAVSDALWEPDDPYQLTTVYGETGEESVEEYEEKVDYREDGKIDAYQSFGISDWLNEDTEMPPDEKTTLVKINFIYRDDGSLFYRDYQHNSRIFATTCQSCDCYYDELERPVCESAYITHGTLFYYHIYDDAGRKPAYELMLDDNLGYFVPRCVRFH